MGRLFGTLGTIIAIGAGFITLVGLVTTGNFFSVGTITNVFLQLVAVTAAVTIIIGVLNLLMVHFGRIGGGRRGWVYSLVLLLSFGLVIGLTVAERFNLLRPQGRPASVILLETVQVSVESALAGLLVFALVFGAYRLMRRRVTFTGLLFTLAVLVFLLGTLPLPVLQPLADVRAWLLDVPVNAGARGILLGIALATVVAGARILIGQDRSYRE